MRINARLDDETKRKLEYLGHAHGATMTQVIKDALALYYAETRRARGGALSMLEEAGFLACGEAEPELSSNYKALLRESLESKHDPR